MWHAEIKYKWRRSIYVEVEEGFDTKQAAEDAAKRMAANINVPPAKNLTMRVYEASVPAAALGGANYGNMRWKS